MKRINALIAPILSPISLLARYVSAYPAARGANTKPKFHPKIAISKYKKAAYTPRPTAVPNAMQAIASLRYANLIFRSLKLILFVFYCSTISSNQNSISHGASKIII